MDTYAETRKPKGKEVIHGGNPRAVARIDKHKHQVELAPIEGGCKAARLTMPPWPGSNVSCQSPQAFLPPQPQMDLLHKRKSQRRARCLNNGDNSWRPTLNCSELGLLGKRAAPILLFAGCHDLSQSCCFGLQPFPDSSKPCLPTTMPHLIFCPQSAT